MGYKLMKHKGMINTNFRILVSSGEDAESCGQSQPYEGAPKILTLCNTENINVLFFKADIFCVVHTHLHTNTDMSL